ncbi:N-acetyl-gamma-glutamyl-phosphate reductase [Acidihalobacter ferrooxydans]|uniref:N-acetyl-gamma-glutamyl-phosphate reductase n=1 Tax=Acidihalobacter ferrooxydans TaxID=1765967 RepID=A0A1P8UDK9_9GAMM|nr:N-acetyl-gamma-glutamyl-phosphate reductase [Acidihalobacter ferrooxydans]APZ41893.1 N-acetyl-gamma-glutamyl-phosphate reductase [Acidihalobacter ferrooxydans]
MGQIKVGVVGGTGYAGVEIIRLLLGHPHAQLTALTSRADAGRRVDEVFPNLRGYLDLTFVAPDAARLHDCDVVFFATPNGTAMHDAPRLLDAGVRVIDLAADFRLQDVAEWSRWYGMAHACPERVPEAVYGLPEINREAIRSARLVANPGCYPTAIILGFLPLLRSGAVEPGRLIADAKSGASGAGRKAAITTLLTEAADNFHAYGVSGHRHLPEIREVLGARLGAPVDLVFVPHLLPMIRGIHATLYAGLRDARIDLQDLYETAYRDEPFVDVMPPGSHPETRSVRGGNLCRIAVSQAPGSDTAVVLSVIDNLVKGAAGQAVQNMNLMFGLREATGLESVSPLP